MLRTFVLILFLCLPSLAGAQTVKLPDDMTVAPGDLLPVHVIYDGDDMQVSVSKGLTVFRVYDPDPKKYSMMVYVPPKAEAGKYTITAAVCKANKLGPLAQCTVSVGGEPGPFDKSKRATPPPVVKAPTRIEPPCSPACTCGCNEGYKCRCNMPVSVAQPAFQPTSGLRDARRGGSC